MPKIRSSEEIATKYQTVTPQRAGEYEAGVRNPLRSWKDSTLAAAAAQAAGVQAAIANKSFEKGVAKAGDETWKAGAVTKGPGRFAEGVATAGDAYREGFSPYREVIERTALPPRGPKGSPSNIARVAAITNALHAAKVKA